MGESTGIWALLATLFGGGALGTAATVLTRFLLDRKKQGDSQELAIAGQSIEQYSALVGRLEARITKVEADHQKCMDEHVMAARQLGVLEGRVAELKECVKDNTAAIAAKVS